MNKALIAGLMLGTLLGGCASLPRYPSSDEVYARNKLVYAQAHETFARVEQGLQDKLDRLAAKVEADKPATAAMFARLRQLNKHNAPLGYVPKSLEYEMVMSGANDRLDQIQRDYEHDKFQAESNARTDAMEREIERGQRDSRYGHERLWPEACGEYLHHRHHVDCED